MIEQSFEVITPLFGGGVKLNNDEERRQIKEFDETTPVRSSAVRGHLRFWWRATCRCWKERGTFKYPSVEAMREAEGRIWGLASQPGAVSLAICQQPKSQPLIEIFEMHQGEKGLYNPRPRKGYENLAYACFPLQPPGSKPHKLTPGNLRPLRGEVKMVLEVPKEYEKEVRLALDAWLAFGGLGARTRRGFGAVSPLSLVEPKETLTHAYVSPEESLPGVPSLLPSFTTLKKNGYADAITALGQGIDRLRLFRQGERVGRNPGKKQNQPGRSRWPEPDEIRRITKQAAEKHNLPLSNIHSFPRAAFGLPIIFHFKDKDDPIDTTLKPKGADRRASPLIIRPYRMDSDKYGVIAVILHESGWEHDALELVSKANSTGVRSSLTEAEAQDIHPIQDNGGHTDPLMAFLKYFKK